MTGSSRAELQTWEIDVVRGIATLVAATGRRQIYPMAGRLDVKPIAAKIAAIIIEGRENNRIKRTHPSPFGAPAARTEALKC
jgi:hypothetical protein